MTVFVDTGAFIALQDGSDQHHAAACRYQAALAAARRPLVTSNYVLDETYTWLRMSLGHRVAVDFGQRVGASRVLSVVRISSELEAQAWQIFCQYDDKTFSFTDCTSFALMRQYDLSTAFAFDHHFEQFGFSLEPEF